MIYKISENVFNRAMKKAFGFLDSRTPKERKEELECKTMKNKTIIEEFKKLYGDDLDGGCRDKYIKFILKTAKEEYKKGHNDCLRELGKTGEKWQGNYL